MMNNNASLVVVGCGIKFLSHLTTEAKSYITQSDVVLYLVNDPAMKEWIKANSPNAESLDALYGEYSLRISSYRAVTAYILQTLRKMQHVCVVLYGHPSLFSQPGLSAVIEARQQGFYAKILPGISAEDCLVADLCIDVGASGSQSFEATDFLLYRRQFDVTSHLILWQVDVIGMFEHATRQRDSQYGIRILANHLSQHYSDEHEVVIYEAAQYPSFDYQIQKLQLKDLSVGKFSAISTLYVPPALHARYDVAMAEKLGINIHKLEK